MITWTSVIDRAILVYFYLFVLKVTQVEPKHANSEINAFLLVLNFKFTDFLFEISK